MRHLARLALLHLAGVCVLPLGGCGDDAVAVPDAAPPAAGDADYTRSTPVQRRAVLDAARRKGLDALHWQYFLEYVGGVGDCPPRVRDADSITVTGGGCVDSHGRVFEGSYRLQGRVLPLFDWRHGAQPYDIDASFDGFEVDDPVSQWHKSFDGTLRMSRPGDASTAAVASADLTQRELGGDEPLEIHVAATWRTAALGGDGSHEEHVDAGGFVELPGIGRGFIEGSWSTGLPNGTVSLRGRNLLTLQHDGTCEVLTIDGAEVERTCRP